MIARFISPACRAAVLFFVSTAVVVSTARPVDAQEARRRWDRMCTIRAEKFDHVLPQAMRDNDIDMWVTVMREGSLDPLWEALRRGYVGD